MKVSLTGKKVLYFKENIIHFTENITFQSKHWLKEFFI